jgi:nucleotide-binding universal stress UspA family protein
MRNPIADYEERMATAASRILSSVAAKAKELDVACATLHVNDRHPAEGIIEMAQVQMCDLIVMASHGRRGLARLIIGSQANRVVTLSPVPVLICR